MNPIFAKLLGGIALVLAVFFGIQYVRHLGAVEQEAKDKVVAQELKLKTDAALLAANNKAIELERKWQALTDQQNLKDTQNEKIATANSARVRAAESHGRLRDPNATPCSSGESKAASSPSDSSADGAQTTGLLSVPITDLLERALREADAINDAYSSCRAQAIGIRASDSP
jgi:hypothetical protein